MYIHYFSIPVLDFPSCVIGDQVELTAEALVCTNIFRTKLSKINF